MVRGKRKRLFSVRLMRIHIVFTHGHWIPFRLTFSACTYRVLFRAASSVKVSLKFFLMRRVLSLAVWIFAAETDQMRTDTRI